MLSFSLYLGQVHMCCTRMNGKTTVFLILCGNHLLNSRQHLHICPDDIKRVKNG